MTEVAEDVRQLDLQIEQHRPELTAYCYRMLGSRVRGRGRRAGDDGARLAGARQLRGPGGAAHLAVRIATNVCLDMLNDTRRRARPMDLGPSSRAKRAGAAPWPSASGSARSGPRVLPADGDPAELAVRARRIRLAFVAALQHLRREQRAVLILRDVLRWKAAEVAELLDAGVAR